VRRAAPLVLLLGCAAAPSSPAPEAAPANGFRFQGAGDSELVLEGLIQTTLGWFGDDRVPSSDATLKRVRPELSGHVEWLRFKLEPKFTEDEVELEEAWVGADVSDGRLMFGRMKVPFGLEEVRSRRHIDFPAFSLVNQLSPAEDHGVFYNGASGDWEYGLSLSNGSGGGDTNASKDLAARAMVRPFAGDEGGTLQHLGLGLAATVGDADEGVGGDGFDNEAGLPVVVFSDGAALDGSRTRVGLEAEWMRGPWFAQGELAVVQQDMSAGAAAHQVGISGGYLTLSRALTGEDKTFGGVDPADPFDLRTGAGRGAWVLALRLSQLELDDDLLALGLADAGRATDRLRSTSVGLNWIPNRSAIERHALVWSDYGHPVDLGRGRDDGELALVIELQLHF